MDFLQKKLIWKQRSLFLKNSTFTLLKKRLKTLNYIFEQTKCSMKRPKHWKKKKFSLSNKFSELYFLNMNPEIFSRVKKIKKFKTIN